MKKKLHSLFYIAKNAAAVILAFCLAMAVPTGWLYDMQAGTGTEQGQRPGGSVRQILRQEDVRTFFYARTPAAMKGGELAPCPLMCLRDTEQEGNHYYRKYGGRRAVYISEYIGSDYPLSVFDRAVQSIAGGFYNRYYLMKLEDGSWLCVYFDDYLVLTGTDDYPVGYVRHAAAKERSMLNQMAADYDVNSLYVLDMYRHGKADWRLDSVLRMAVLFIIVVCLVMLHKNS